MGKVRWDGGSVERRRRIVINGKLVVAEYELGPRVRGLNSGKRMQVRNAVADPEKDL